MIRVLIVDDSVFMRHSVQRMLSQQADIEVVGLAADGETAIAMTRQLRPDVIALDIEMPRMNGLQALEVIMREQPTPVVMLSSTAAAGAPATIRALELGAVDFLQKPAPPAIGITGVEQRLVAQVRGAATAWVGRSPAQAKAPCSGTRLQVRPPTPDVPVTRAERVLAIGCSTGGPRALVEVVPRLPANLPAAVLIVQHMPPGFTQSLAARLDVASSVAVREAVHGDIPLHGLALLAPGGKHMALDQSGRVVLSDAPPVHGVRPSVDVLFNSLAPVYGSACVAVVLTGMGSDGGDGARVLHDAGASVIAEDQSTAVVWGMPRAVVERGAADVVAPLHEIAGAAVDSVLRIGSHTSERREHGRPAQPVALQRNGLHEERDHAR